MKTKKIIGDAIIIIVFIGLIILVSFSFKDKYYEFKEECDWCVERDCQDNDMVCGDFGKYWFILLFHFGGICLLVVLLPITLRLNHQNPKGEYN